MWRGGGRHGDTTCGNAASACGAAHARPTPDGASGTLCEGEQLGSLAALAMSVRGRRQAGVCGAYGGMACEASAGTRLAQCWMGVRMHGGTSAECEARWQCRRAAPHACLRSGNLGSVWRRAIIAPKLRWVLRHHQHVITVLHCPLPPHFTVP